MGFQRMFHPKNHPANSGHLYSCFLIAMFSLSPFKKVQADWSIAFMLIFHGDVNSQEGTSALQKDASSQYRHPRPQTSATLHRTPAITWLFNMTSWFLFGFRFSVFPFMESRAIFHKVTAGIPLLQAVALLIMMPLFTFMGIKVSVLAGHLRGAINLDAESDSAPSGWYFFLATRGANFDSGNLH